MFERKGIKCQNIFMLTLSNKPTINTFEDRFDLGFDELIFIQYRLDFVYFDHFLHLFSAYVKLL